MTDTHSSAQRGNGPRRAAVAADQARVVRRYLSAIESDRPGRSAKRLSDAIGNRITKVDELLVSADPLSRVHLTQERIELHAELVRLDNGSAGDVAALERDFVRVVRSYGDRHGISYAAWRQVGVDAKVLERAGIHRAERKPPPAARAAAENADAGRPTGAGSPPAPEPSPPPAPEPTPPAAGAGGEAPPPDPSAPPADVTVVDDRGAVGPGGSRPVTAPAAASPSPAPPQGHPSSNGDATPARASTAGAEPPSGSLRRLRGEESPTMAELARLLADETSPVSEPPAGERRRPSAEG